jgi:hypothetical protein
VAKQRTYNIDTVDDMLKADPKAVRVTSDFGASYFIDGSRFVTLIFFLKYFEGETHDFATECLYNIVTDPDERSEDAFYTRAVWEHHLGTSGEFDSWHTIILERDSGPHFQNNNICFYETTIGPRFNKHFIVSAFAKRHGFNECDGALARFVRAVRDQALESKPPTNAMQAANTVNTHAKFKNCSAYYFNKIDRNPALFPKLSKFNGIQALALCEFKYDFLDAAGLEVQEPGYVLARPISGEGPWVFHDYLPHTREKSWGRVCLSCSAKKERAVYHKSPSEPLKVCLEAVHRARRVARIGSLIQPDASLINADLQPVPRSQQPRVPVGPESLQCSVLGCNTVCKNARGLAIHARSAHRGQVPQGVFVIPRSPQEEKKDVGDEAGGAGQGKGGRGGRGGRRGGRGGRSGARGRQGPPVNYEDRDSDADESSSDVADLPDRRARPARSRAARGGNLNANYEEKSDSSEDSGDDQGFNGLDEDGDPIYEVDEIVGEQGEGDDLEYLVYWAPRALWPAPSWQHFTCLTDCDEVLRIYMQSKND